MGSKFVPMVTGTSADRAGAIPMPMFNLTWNCSPLPCTPLKRRSFSLYWPYDGTWNTVWDPFGAGTLDTACPFGLDKGDQPFTGFDLNGDYRADLGIYRDVAAGGSATIFTYDYRVGCYGGTIVPQPCSTCDVRTRAFAVSDMTGDGREELVLIHPDTMTIEWRTSESGYATPGGTWAVDNPLAVFL